MRDKVDDYRRAARVMRSTNLLLRLCKEVSDMAADLRELKTAFDEAKNTLQMALQEAEAKVASLEKQLTDKQQVIDELSRDSAAEQQEIDQLTAQINGQKLSIEQWLLAVVRK